MNGMTAGHFVTGAPRRKEILLTDGTVGLVLANLAVVIVVEGPVDAHATVVAVFKVLGAADAAKAAIGTMIGTFFC